MAPGADRYDCIIVGGGPAGLSAALVLGRARRHVLVCDTGEGRNRTATAVHGYLTRDGIEPARFRELAQGELARYPTVRLRRVGVEDAVRLADGFEVRLAGGDRLRARALLIATGVTDQLPDIEGLAPLYGRSVHHCPYCDGWEYRDGPLAAYGRGEAGAKLALALFRWSRDVVWCADGDAAVPDPLRRQLAAAGIAVREERVARLEECDGRLAAVVLGTGERLARTALFFAGRPRQASQLAERLGCRLDPKGTVPTGPAERTEVPGVYVAGDASKDAQLAIVAAAEGAEAAVAIDTALAQDDLAALVQL